MNFSSQILINKRFIRKQDAIQPNICCTLFEQKNQETGVGESGVSWDTGSRGTVAGKIVVLILIYIFFSTVFRFMPSS